MLAHIAAAVPAGQHVADLYGGVGTIALHLALSAQSVHCVESFAESIELCNANILSNQRTNVTAEVADVAEFLKSTDRAFDTIVVDPPRVGLGAQVCKEILRHRPQRLVYVSCNPLSQIEDAKLLAEGYALTSLVGYDMFPQTPHFETLAIFDRRP
jgi:tRNA/tmRNA/rRNA uracil-C5-methylase (TrmA/RlmC/RlmD family)